MEHFLDGIEKLTLSEIVELSSAEKAERGITHTSLEILQQPETWLETFQIIKKSQKDLKEFLQKSGLNGTAEDNLFVSLIGAGTSDYIGRALVSLLRKKWRCRVEAVPSTDLLTELDEFVQDSPPHTRHLWISFSRSGDSFEGVKIIQEALEKYPQIHHLVITCNESGKMEKLCADNANTFCLVLSKKVNDLGLAMTSSFTNMIVAGQCLAHLDELDEYEKIVRALAEANKNILPETVRLAKEIVAKNFTRICFLGSGALKSLGAESALKIMELTAGKFSVMSESFLGLRHGPLSWLNQESLVIAFFSNNPAKSQIELGLIQELKSKKAAGSILAIMPNEEIKAETDFQLPLDVPAWLDDNYRPPLDVLFAQCLGFFGSLYYGLKPDAPSVDGKIQRVVSKIG